MTDVVIVDYNSGDVLEACLASVERAQKSGADIGIVCVVVNGALSQAVDERAKRGVIRVVHPPANVGFSAACNLGAAVGTGQFILFLNPDTEVSVAALKAPADYLSRPGHEHLGICGVTLTTPEGATAASCCEFPTFRHVVNKALGLGYLSPGRFKTGMMVDWDHGSTRVVDCVMGAFFFVRRELFSRLAGFDERFFVYYEDLDFAIRAKAIGFLTVFVHDASIRHIGRATTDRIPGRRLYYLLRSRAAYARKHLGLGSALATWWLSLVVEIPARVTLASLGGRGTEARAAIEAWARLWKFLLNRLYRRGIKRALDVSLSLVALLLTSPVLLLLAGLVRLCLGSPVLFRQERPGLRGRSFHLLKFRTMRDDRNATGHPAPDADRLAPFGRFLRSTSLDELPELWNVIRGDMSLVGPRPLLMQYLPRYTAEQARRHDVRPGVTGWAQVHGRNTLTWDQKFARDVWYVDHVSFLLDLKIIGLTCGTVFSRRGISSAGEATMSEFMGSEGSSLPAAPNPAARRQSGGRIG